MAKKKITGYAKNTGKFVLKGTTKALGLGLAGSGIVVNALSKWVNVTVYKEMEGSKIVFFKGYTDSSGIIDKIPLPAPKLITNDLETPNKQTYDIESNYNNDISNYKVNIYENVYVVQTINIIPKMNIGGY